MSDKDFNKTEPFVPGKDERIGHRETPKPASPKATYAAAPQSGEPQSASVGVLWKMLVVILLLGIGGLGWLVYQQEQRQAALQGQFDDLQYRLSSTDESLSQSGATIGMKLQDHDKTLKKHFSEIDKLWAARNVNKKGIDTANKERESLKKQLASVGSQAKKAERNVASASQAALAVRAELEEVETLSDATLSRLDAMERSLKQWQIEMNKRVAGNEEAINAIDSFRRQTNREIQQIRQQLRPQSATSGG